MNLARWIAYVVLAASCCIQGIPVFAQIDAESEALHFGRSSETTEAVYDRTYALVVGSDYAGRQTELVDEPSRRALPELRHAESDATKLKDLLKNFYGYEEGASFEDGAELVCLVGKQATFAAIEKELSWLRSEKVTERDSVLLYFAGHGQSVDDASKLETFLFYPHDVLLSQGIATGNDLRFHTNVIDRFKDCRAKHKLIVIDACHSGRIFARGAAASHLGERDGEQLFDLRSCQGFASCLGSESASDGSWQTERSPFADAIQKALLYVPLRGSKYDEPVPIAAQDVYREVRTRMRDAGAIQLPELRSLTADEGEFLFVPVGSKSWEEVRPAFEHTALLQATVSTEQGAWWFEEMPWFIPAIRADFASQYSESVRGPEDFALFRRDTLRDWMKDYVRAEVSASNVDATGVQPSSVSLPQLRRSFARDLLVNHDRSSFQDTLRKIAESLKSRKPGAAGLRPSVPEADETPKSAGSSSQKIATAGMDETLKPEDLHLLAVVYHALEEYEKAGPAYEEAIRAFAKLDPSGSSASVRAAKALCLADQAQFFRDSGDPSEAAKAFRDVYDVFNKSAPPAFRMFVMCSESDCLLEMNRFAQANERLRAAIAESREIDANHFITAEIYRRLAWAHMIQWRIAEAEEFFEESNATLVRFVTDEAQAAQSKEGSAAPLTAAELASGRSVGDSADVYVKVMYFHNLHGLAMANRFRGDASGSARQYREIVNDLFAAIDATKNVTAEVAVDADEQLCSRLINSLERLGDCNLFAPPESRNLHEAFDDYRRARALIHRLPSKDRRTLEAQLLYKQSLALALRYESGQGDGNRADLDLAIRSAREADRRFADLEGRPSSLLNVLHALTTPMIELVAERNDRSSAAEGPSSAFAWLASDHASEVRTMREAIVEFREENGPDLHRDQLELCLLACRTLLSDESRERFETHEDVALLASLCRMAMTASLPRTPDAAEGQWARGGETQAYLRPYYDLAMTSLIESEPTSAKELIELHYEAMNGRRFLKHSDPDPILAAVTLNGRGYLFIDVPGGASEAIELAPEMTERIAVASSSVSNESLLRLPARAENCLAQLRLESEGSDRFVDCWCERGDRRIVAAKPVVGEDDALPTSVETIPSKAQTRFPFVLPTGFTQQKVQAASDPALANDAQPSAVSVTAP